MQINAQKYKLEIAAKSAKVLQVSGVVPNYANKNNSCVQGWEFAHWFFELIACFL